MTLNKNSNPAPDILRILCVALSKTLVRLCLFKWVVPLVTSNKEHRDKAERRR